MNEPQSIASSGVDNRYLQPNERDVQYPPCGTAMLFSAETPFERRDYSCVVFPERLGESQNSQKNNIGITLFVNGVLNSESDSAQSAALLADNLGRPVIRVHNSTETLRLPLFALGAVREMSLPVPDFVNAAIAKISPALSELVEPSVSVLRGAMARVLKRDNNTLIDIHAHSQGAIIVRGALRDLRSEEFAEFTDDEWSRIKERIQLTTYGSAEHNFDIETREYAHTLDIVPLGTAFVDWIRRRISDSRESHSDHSLLSASHSFQSYMSDLPEFLADELKVRPDEKPASLAERFRQLFGSGYYSNKVRDATLEKVKSQLPTRDRGELDTILSSQAGR